MSKQPFLPLFFGDFLASTAEWSGEEASLYLTLLGHQWTLGTLPADPAKLARLVRWERKSFDKCWPQVSAKFTEHGGRLANSRLELHRAKSEELAEKNRTSGRKGAEARWRKDGERYGDGMAHAKEPLCHPSHPIPSHPESPDLPLAQASSLSARILPGSARDEFPVDPQQLADQIRQTYPPGTFPEADWIIAAKHIGTRLDRGVTGQQLLDAVTAFAEQQRAKGSAGTQFIVSPARFFEGDRGRWCGPFPMPLTKAEIRRDANISASQTWLEQQDANNAA